MLKKFILLVLIIIILPGFAFADNVFVKITPEKKISTSDKTVQEGNYYNFIVVEDSVLNGKTYFKKGDVITGLLTERTENGTEVKNASLYFTQFKKDSLPIDTVLYVKGNQRDLFYETLGTVFIKYRLCEITRGGEVKMKPNKNLYILEFEVKQ